MNTLEVRLDIFILDNYILFACCEVIKCVVKGALRMKMRYVALLCSRFIILRLKLAFASLEAVS